MTRNDKSKSKHEKRKHAEGQRIVKLERSKAKADHVGEKKARRQKEADAAGQKRVGIPQPPLLGVRTKKPKYRESLRINQFMTLINLEESKRIPDRLHITGFDRLLGDQSFAVLLRLFINPLYSFYGYSQIRLMLYDFVNRFRLNKDVELPTAYKERLVHFRNNRSEMERCVGLYGPAFIPNGLVTHRNKIVHIHRIPMKDGSLMFAQMRFLDKHPITLDLKLARGGGDAPSGKPEAPSSKQQKRKDKKEKKKKEKQANSELKSSDESTNPNETTGQPEVSKPLKEKPKTNYPSFKYRAKLDGVKVHTVADMNHDEYLDSLIPTDCQGAPFCGYVSLDLICGQKPDIHKYEDLLQDFGSDDAYDIGTPNALENYAICLNVNLAIFKRRSELGDAEIDQGMIPNETEGGLICIHRSVDHGVGPWAILLHTGPLTGGHYVPMVGKKVVEIMPIPEPVYPDSHPLFFEHREEHRKVLTLVDNSGRDNRPPNLRREKAEIVDTYSLIGKTTVIYYNWLVLAFLALIIIFEIISHCTFTYKPVYTTYANPVRLLWNSLYYYIDLMFHHQIHYVDGYVRHTSKRITIIMVECVLFPYRGQCRDIGPFVYVYYDWQRIIRGCRMALWLVASIFSWFFRENTTASYSWYSGTYEISNCITRTLDTQLQNSNLETANWDIINKLKFIDTNHTIEGVLMNTKAYILEVYKYRKKIVTAKRGTRGLVALNTLNSSAYLSPETLNIIAAQQYSGLVRGSGNYVKKAKIGRDATKVDVPIACCPIGTPVTDLGPVGPGLIPATDSIGVIVAFCGRSMIREDYDDPIIDEFIAFAEEFLQPFIDGTDCSFLSDEDPITFFRSHYHGKRSNDWIEGTIKQYMFYEQGLADISFDTNSCFVKLENSSKRLDGGYTIKPRLIMTMSPVMLFNCCQILKVIDRWNHGPFSRFQIKDMEPKEMIEKIVEMSDRHHMVTDYSSFESSITEKIRKIENFVIMSLLYKANMPITAAHFEERAGGQRVLRSHGITMNIESRCSGDPHTSCGNGIINVCISAFCAFKNGLDLSSDFILAEGDDGLMPVAACNVGLVKRLGFKFSTDVMGCYPGDTDFLRRRWIDGKAFLNIGRSLSVFWVKNKANLSLNKQKFILRCMGCSLHHMSPGHPILYSIVNRIGIETAGITKFKNWFLHIDMYRWPDFDVDNYPSNVVCDESMRCDIAAGALGFPPISIQAQLDLERIFHVSEDMYIGHLLNDYEEVECYVNSLEINRSQRAIYSDSVLKLLRIIGVENF